MTYCRRNCGKLLLVKKFSNYGKNLGNRFLDADLCNCRRNSVKLFLLVKKLSVNYHLSSCRWTGKKERFPRNLWQKRLQAVDFLLPFRGEQEVQPVLQFSDSWIPGKGKGALLSIFRYFHYQFCHLLRYRFNTLVQLLN